jgi:hypothetical protein
MGVVQGESRMAWPGLQADNYSRRQAAVSEEKDAQYRLVVSPGWPRCGAIRDRRVPWSLPHESAIRAIITPLR